MFTVYILRDKSGNLYKGATSNLKARLIDHKHGGTRTTSRMEEIEVIYTEEYDTWTTARGREKYFKTAAGRRFLKTKLPS